MDGRALFESPRHVQCSDNFPIVMCVSCAGTFIVICFNTSYNNAEYVTSHYYNSNVHVVNKTLAKALHQLTSMIPEVQKSYCYREGPVMVRWFVG